MYRDQMKDKVLDRADITVIYYLQKQTSVMLYQINTESVS